MSPLSAVDAFVPASVVLSFDELPHPVNAIVVITAAVITAKNFFLILFSPLKNQLFVSFHDV